MLSSHKQLENMLSQELHRESRSFWMPDDLFYFFLGAFVNRQIPLDKAWSFPNELASRLNYGKITPHIIALTDVELLRTTIMKKPAMHRYHYIAQQVQDMCILLLDKYEGRPENIWSTAQTATELIRRLREFRGIGQKLSNMIAWMLIDSGYGLFSDIYNIDMPIDVHVERVLSRMGYTTKDDMLQLARRLSPKYPAKLDLILFNHGQDICKSRNPLCVKCRFSNVCPKHI